MKKFKFKMQSVLDVREAQRKAREMELLSAREALRAEEDALSRINKRMLEALDPKRFMQARNAFYFIQRERYLKKLKDAKRVQEYRVNEARCKVESALSRLKEAMTELKKMEKCKEREFAGWNLDYRREEQRLNDELASSRAHIRILAGSYE